MATGRQQRVSQFVRDDDAEECACTH